MSRQATIGAFKDCNEHIDSLKIRDKELKKQRRELIILLHEEYGMSFTEIASHSRFSKAYINTIYYNWNGNSRVVG